MRPFSMPQPLSNVLIHLVFSIKERRPLLQHTTKREAMLCYLAGIPVRRNCLIIRVS